MTEKKRQAGVRLRGSMQPVVLLLGALSFLGYAAVSTSAQVPDTAQTMDSIIKYSDSSDLKDPIAELQKKLDAGRAKLEFDPKLGYLPSLLKALDVPVSSQTLVFSKTSSQADFTSPKRPRAIYFNERVYLALAHGSFNLDVIAIDPRKGAIFYTIDQFEQARPKFERQDECFNCHFGPKTLDVPGLFLRSITTTEDGTPIGQANDFVSGHNSPLKMRWGGWYVTGTHGNDEHLGNVYLGRVNDLASLDLRASSNITDLSGMVETEKYPSPHSDAVALLVLDHNTRMQNYLIQSNFETRMAIYDREEIRRKNLDPSRDWSEKRIAQAGEAMVAHMLFRDEGKLNGPIKGTSDFEEEFAKKGPFDSKGRSLRQFDLKSRVFKYPCSYLIYSESFDNLPIEMRQFVWKRLVAILSGEDKTALYAGMSAEDRKNVFDILIETKSEFRDYYLKTRSAAP